jgi:hypothetical protein
MNAAELARNPRLDSFFVRNLNTSPDGWAAADQSFDAVVCCVRSVRMTMKAAGCCVLGRTVPCLGACASLGVWAVF